MTEEHTPPGQADVDWKEMYLTLMRATEKALRLHEEADRVLVEAQRNCEEQYLAAGE